MATAPAQTRLPRSKKWRWLLLVPAAVLVALTALAGWFYFAARSSLPQLDGTITIAGLQRPVTVIRDGYGVPHIAAENLDDLLFAQAYVTAQDRLWQMDMSRRFAAGELAEILGKGFIKTDRQQRILSLQQVAERSAARLTATHRRQIEAYVRGINAYIDAQRANLPIEFRVLRYSPRPWTVADTFLVGASMAQILNHDTIESELAREKIVARIGPALAAYIYPNRSWRDRVPGETRTLHRNNTQHPERDRLRGSAASIPAGKKLSFRAVLPEAAGRSPERSRRGGNPIGLNIAGRGPSLHVGRSGFQKPSKQQETFEADDPFTPGSNNWVVSGARTVTGKPLLANDMHLAHRIPNTWYEAHLTSGEFDVAGVTLPGTPLVVVGHNRHIAWGFTNLGPDVLDIYVETFNEKGEYLTPSGWKQPERRREIIRVKGEKDVELEVVTTRHGPIASELIPGETRQIALKWTAYDPEGLSFPFGEVNAARNWGEFRRAFSQLRAPAQNVVYADVDGHIGYQAMGAIPIRAAGDGSLPVAGSDDAHEWTGYVPFGELPRVLDPPSGILATANGRVVGDGYRHVLSNEWGSPYRTQRIYKLLESKSKLSSADMLQFQNDIYSELDLLCAKKFSAAVGASKTVSSRAREAGEMMRAWDGRFTKESVAATLVNATRRHLLRMLLESKLGPSLARDYAWYSSSVALENFLTNEPKEWLPANYSDYNELITEAVEKAVVDPASPRDLKNWNRGSAFPLEIQHPVFGALPLLRRWTGPGVVEQSGSAITVKQVGRRFGPSQRMTVDLSDLDKSTLNIVTGQSGHLMSPHYMDQWPLWYEGRSKIFPFSEGAVQMQKAHVLVLQPQNR